jgi:hypothetical protein
MISLLRENIERETGLRGFGGSAGNRSIMTDRGGTGSAGNFRTTRKENVFIRKLNCFYYFY